MIFDPVYFLFVGPAMLLSLWASWKTKSAFNKYSKQRSMNGLTGAEAARLMLERAGVTGVSIKPTSGFLSDHYNPMTRTLALSEAVYGQPTIAAIGVGCHEAGHAIQHAKGYAPLKLRSALVPVQAFGSNFSYLVIFGGMLLGMGGLVNAGILLFCGVVLFQLVTLPVEFDASARAKNLAFQYGLVSKSEQEGMGKVLNAAAMTYVAAAVSSLMTLFYFLLRAGLLGGRDD